MITHVKQVISILMMGICMVYSSNAYAVILPVSDTLPSSTRKQAIEFVDQIHELAPSSVWHNIKPSLFLQNLKATIYNPLSIYPGNATNFCGYGALTYLLLQDDPLGFAKLLLQFYRNGNATFSNVNFNPSSSIKKVAGTLKYKGILDIHPAEQMWYLILADHFKGYLNIFNRNYHPGDEDRLWASVNYAKFNRMVRKLLHYKISARGADLLRPRIGDPFKYISEKIKTGTVVLFINNRVVHKKNHTTLKLGFPTHFIVAEQINMENNIITFIYWDYGGKTLLQVSPAFFKRVIFGISYCTKIGTYAN